MIKINLRDYKKLAELFGPFLIVKNAEILRDRFRGILSEEAFHAFMKHAYEHNNIVATVREGIIDPLDNSAFKAEERQNVELRRRTADGGWENFSIKVDPSKIQEEVARATAARAVQEELYRSRILGERTEGALERTVKDLRAEVSYLRSELQNRDKDIADQVNQAVDELRQELIDAGYIL